MIFENELLIEAQDYTKLFSEIIKYSDKPNDVENEIKEQITKIKKLLKKDDRVIWFLKIYRQNLLKNEISKSTGDNKKKLQDIYLKYNSELISKNSDFILPYYIDNLLTDLLHYYSLNIVKIDNYPLKNETYEEVLNHFKELEDLYTLRDIPGTIKYIKSDMGTEVKIVIDFKDGYYWVKLDREYCEEEGSAMGHCGNKASWVPGDRIFSLRKLIKRNPKDDKTWLWEPSLTFVLDEYGYFGEMKGRSNEKPIKKYHKYIIALLKKDFVVGIEEGKGHLPQNNFSLDDLEDEDEREDLENKLHIKPLISVEDMETYADDSFFNHVDSFFDNYTMIDAEYNYNDVDSSISYAVLYPGGKEEFINSTKTLMDAEDISEFNYVTFENLQFEGVNFSSSKYYSFPTFRNTLKFLNCLGYEDFITNLIKIGNTNKLKKIIIEDEEITDKELEEIESIIPNSNIDFYINGVKKTDISHPKQGKFTFETLIKNLSEKMVINKQLKTLKEKYRELGVKTICNATDEGIINLFEIVVTENKKNQGLGSSYINEVITIAEEHNKIIKVTPIPNLGSELKRLTKFYERFGFVQDINKKSNIPSMYRKPEKEN